MQLFPADFNTWHGTCDLVSMVFSFPVSADIKALMDHVSDPFCLRGAGEGWTPPVRLHRLRVQPRAAGEEAAAQDHQQGTAALPRKSRSQGPRAQYLVRYISVCVSV